MLDIVEYFYKFFLPEVKTGCVSLNNMESVLLKFNYIIVENGERFFYKKKDTFSNEIIPTLIIKNKSEFDRILKEYMNLAYDFYNPDKEKKVGTQSMKCILALTFADLTVEDFNDPIAYLRRLINFMNDNTFEEFQSNR